MPTMEELRRGAGQPADPADPAASKNILQLLGEEKNRRQLTALAGQYMTGERCLALMVNAARKTPKLLECDPLSVLGAMMALAALGLEPNTPTQQAFLIPYKTSRPKRGPDGTILTKPGTNKWIYEEAYECQLQIGYRGFITLAYRSPRVASIEAEAIHQKDRFKHLQGSHGLLEYEKALTDRGPLIGAYCLVKLKSGEEIAVTLPLDELYKSRDKSEAYKNAVRGVEEAASDKERDRALAKYDETPWVLWEDTMAAKTAIKYLVGKRLSLDSNDPLTIASRLDEDPTLDLKALTHSTVAKEVFKDGLDAPALTHEEPERFEFGSVKPRETVREPQARGDSAATVRPLHEPPPDAPDDPIPDGLPFDDGPTLEDALANVERGQDDAARDIARTLGKAAQDEVEAAIAARAPAKKPADRARFGKLE